MSEFIVTTDISSGVVQTGHESRRVLGGDPATLLPKLVEAVERLGYSVLSDQPFQAKRRASMRRIGKIYNATVTLFIGLRPTAGNATAITFSYEVASASMYRGDHATIEREIDAIVALVNRRPSSMICGSCQATQYGDSSFCRSCGAPLADSEPAELEIVRIHSEARYGHRANITGVVLALLTLAIAMPLIFFGAGKGVTVGWALLVLGEVASAFSLILGSYVMHRALNPPNAQLRNASLPVSVLEPAKISAIPGAVAHQPSVTEGTTELLPNRASTSQLD